VVYGSIKSNIQRQLFAGFLQLNSTVFKTLKLVLYSPNDGIPLNLKINLSGNIAYQHGFFEPTLDSSYISLDTTLKMENYRINFTYATPEVKEYK
jgi:hypothetical protein